jgi:hypothetical protein
LFFASGAEVELEKDPSQAERDKYNRLLRYVFVNDGELDYGKFMISLGYAYEYTYDTPYKYQIMYKQAQTEAEQAKKGLWADDACIITPKPTIKPVIPTSKPVAPTTKPIIPTSKPIYVPIQYIAPTNPPSNSSSGGTGGSWTCNCSKTCPNIGSCEEAQYLLNVCGCGARDADKDGIACDAAPLHCQN